MQYIIKNCTYFNRGRRHEGDVHIRDGRIARAGTIVEADARVEEIDGTGKWVIPGLIDDQVHFREPGLTHKATIFTESRAAVAGGVTSFMEMPNTRPPVFTQELLEQKYAIAARDSAANYSFYMGTSNDNLDEVLRTDPAKVCGVKIFMGSSTGNLLVDDDETLDGIFARVPLLIAAHCEDEQTIRDNLALAQQKYGRHIPPSMHPVIRSREACLLSSSKAVDLAKKHGTRLHVLHITTRDELSLFSEAPVSEKHITCEACVHHMTFSDKDYVPLGHLIKCNPAIKQADDRDAIIEAVDKGVIDVVATDHAPHTTEEKASLYEDAPSGMPLVQHALVLLLQLYFDGKLTMEKIVERACHAPAKCFHIEDRGYLDEGYRADLVMIDPDTRWSEDASALLYKCGWTPLRGREFRGKVHSTFVNGEIVYRNGELSVGKPGMRLTFDR